MHSTPYLADGHDPAPGPTPPGAVDDEPLQPDDDLRLITIDAAAERLGLSRSKVYLLIADGELPTIHIGRARRIALSDLRAFVERHRAA